MTILIEIKKLTKAFASGTIEQLVLKEISLVIPTNKLIAIQGPSGCGKTTFLSILGTLLKPTSGNIYMLRNDITCLTEKQLTYFRNKNIGFIFQFHHLLPDFTVLENVYFPAAGAIGRITSDIKDYSKYLLAQVGLDNFRNYKVNELSGGQKQRVAIARALINKPKLILADEPTGNLDSSTAYQVMNLLKEIQKSDKTTFIISTHDKEIAKFCSIKIQMLDGQIADVKCT